MEEVEVVGVVGVRVKAAALRVLVRRRGCPSVVAKMLVWIIAATSW